MNGSGSSVRDRAELARRVRLALGPEPLSEAGHLLAPLPVSSPAAALPPGPQPATQFIVDIVGSTPLSGERVAEMLTAARRASVFFPQVWATQPAGGGGDVWLRPEKAPPNARFDRLALCWDLTVLLSEGIELARDLGARFAQAARLATNLGRTAGSRESIEAAVARAVRLNDLRARFGRSVELRLVPLGRPFPARQVWRAAYALGLRWGELDLFHWYDAAGRQRLFTLSALGEPGYFLPEHAQQGQSVAGIALGFELPCSFAPVAVFDRMALALAYLRHHLNGRATAAAGRELDADALDAERDALEQMVAEMARDGIAPGSPEAVHLF